MNNRLCRTGHRPLGILLAGTLAVCGCGGGSNEVPPATAGKTAAPPAAAKPATAQLTGKVIFQGDPPKNTRIQMDADAVCKKSHGAEVYTQEYVIGKGGEMANVFVYVKSGLQGQTYPTPTDTVVFDQRGCEYYPHVFGLRVKQPLAIVNSDPTLHNVHAMPTKSSQFNMAMPTEGMRVVKTFDQPEVMVRIKCDVHSWMAAYVGVLNHPFFAATGEDGRFSIGPLPPGTYELEAWHEKLGTRTMTVTVGDHETKDVSFTFSKQGT